MPLRAETDGQAGQHAAMESERVTADIPEPAVPGHQKPTIACGRSEQFRIVGSGEPLGCGAVDLVAEGLEWRCSGRWEVLVELDPHWAATAGYSSRASQAP